MADIESIRSRGLWRVAIAMLVASVGLSGCGVSETDSSVSGTGIRVAPPAGGGPATGDGIAPSTPTGVAAAAASPTQVNLSWSDSTDNVGVTGYRIFRNGVLLTTLSGNIPYQDTSVSAAVTYSYTVAAFDGAGNASPQSTAAIVATPATFDTAAPSPPTGITAIAVSAFQVDLSWPASTDNVAVTGYRLFRNGQLQIALGNVTTYQDMPLFAGNTYIYTVQAVDGAGNVSGSSPAASATTPAVPDTTAPTTPGNFSANAVSPSQINLSWSASTDNFGVLGYRVYRNGALLIALLGNVTTYQNTGLTPSTTYSYNVDAIDAASNVSGLSPPAIVTTPATPDTTAPSAPFNLTANAISASRIDLSWAAATDNVAVIGYRVFRNGTLLGTLGNVTATANTGLTAATTYSYTVRALDAAGNVSGPSTAASATTQAGADAIAPTTPTNVTANAVSASQIDLNWTASTDNVAVTGYRIYRNGVFLGAVGNVTTAQNTGLTPSTAYSYNLDAIDATGNASGISTPAAGATTQASGPTGTPSIGGVSGTFSQGQSIAIAGSSFGSNANGGPMLWDNFDGGSNGAVVADGSTGAVPLVHQGNLSGYSRWQRDGGGEFSNQSIVFNNGSPKANSSHHARATFSNGSYWGLNLYVPYTQFTTGNELYISFYYRSTKTGANFPRQIKPWIAYDSNWQDKIYWNPAFDNCQAGGYRTHITELEQEHYFSTGGPETDGEWVRFESYLKQSGPDVANGTWQQMLYRPSLATPKKEFYSTGVNQKLRTSSANFVNWTFGGAYYSMCGPSDTGTIDVDDFYMDNTQARVEVCDSTTWSARTRCELQIPTTWSDTSITATFNKGYLNSSNPAYVYVIDAGGNVNAQGFAITLP